MNLIPVLPACRFALGDTSASAEAAFAVLPDAGDSFGLDVTIDRSNGGIKSIVNSGWLGASFAHIKKKGLLNMMRKLVLIVVGLMTGVAMGSESFTFASWNIGHYALGKDWKTAVKPEEAEEKACAYRKLLDEVGANFLGVCEYFDSFTTASERRADTSVFGRYAHRVIGPQREWQWNAQFWNGEAASGSRWQTYVKHLQSVYYIATRVKVGGEDVMFVQTHLDWAKFKGHEDDRASQMRELIAEFKDERYVVIAGDFNVGVRFFEDRTKKTLDDPSEYKVFEKAGFTLGNDGRFKTAPAGDSYLSLDNIIVKGLEITDFRVWDCPELSDHALVSAKITLKIK